MRIRTIVLPSGQRVHLSRIGMLNYDFDRDSLWWHLVCLSREERSHKVRLWQLFDHDVSG